MGLDMYLNKVKKVDGMTFEELLEANENLDELIKTGAEPYSKIKAEVYEAGEYVHWMSITRQVAYWRKANAIHRWFVDKVQDGVDECQCTLVTKEQLEELLGLAREVLKNPKKGPKLLPTCSGFFFGGTAYDEGYLEYDIKKTVEQLEKVLAETDFDAYHVYYHSSW